MGEKNSLYEDVKDVREQTGEELSILREVKEDGTVWPTCKQCDRNPVEIARPSYCGPTRRCGSQRRGGVI